MRFIFVIVLLLSFPRAQAQEPSRSIIESYRAYFDEMSKDNSMDGILALVDGLTCFEEHLCASGPIGADPNCEETASFCLSEAYAERKGFTAEHYEKTCPRFFAKLTAPQLEMIAQPPSCKIPPPKSALRPVANASDMMCIAKTTCQTTAQEFRSQCVNDWMRCSEDMSVLTPSVRDFCRRSRRAAERYAFADGTCQKTSDAPVLWSPEITPSHVDVEAFENAHPELKNEADLDELDF